MLQEKAKLTAELTASIDPVEAAEFPGLSPKERRLHDARASLDQSGSGSKKMSTDMDEVPSLKKMGLHHLKRFPH